MQAESLKEAIGWLKVVFSLLVAIDISLITWLAQNIAAAQPQTPRSMTAAGSGYRSPSTPLPID